MAEPEPVPQPDPEPQPAIVDPEPQPVAPATPVSISATVKSAERHVGDQLNASDFTVTVTMSDGTVKNPNGWTANPMTLASESNVITISYNGLTTTVTVPAVIVSIGEPPLPPEPQPQPANTPPAHPTSQSQVYEIYDWAIANYGWSYKSYDFGDGPYYFIKKGGYQAELLVWGPGKYDVYIYDVNNSVYVYEYSGSDLTGMYNFITTH